MAARRKAKKAKGRYPGVKSFALGKGRYPINTKKRARSALSRISAHGTSAQKTKVRRAVKRKYPSIKVSGLRKGRK
jgi:hypothetical protein